MIHVFEKQRGTERFCYIYDGFETKTVVDKGLRVLVWVSQNAKNLLV